MNEQQKEQIKQYMLAQYFRKKYCNPDLMIIGTETHEQMVKVAMGIGLNEVNAGILASEVLAMPLHVNNLEKRRNLNQSSCSELDSFD